MHSTAETDRQFFTCLAPSRKSLSVLPLPTCTAFDRPFATVPHSTTNTLRSSLRPLVAYKCHRGPSKRWVRREQDQ